MNLLFGWLFLLLGIVGIPLPLLPTTPFLLLSAFFFSRSSPRLHRWLRGHRIFGPIIRDWEEHGCISLKAKISATIAIVLLFGLSLLLGELHLALDIMLVLIAMGVLVFIWTRPSGDVVPPP